MWRKMCRKDDPFRKGRLAKIRLLKLRKEFKILISHHHYRWQWMMFDERNRRILADVGCANPYSDSLR